MRFGARGVTRVSGAASRGSDRLRRVAIVE